MARDSPSSSVENRRRCEEFYLGVEISFFDRALLLLGESRPPGRTEYTERGGGEVEGGQIGRGRRENKNAP